jgi:hypothetical protein
MTSLYTRNALEQLIYHENEHVRQLAQDLIKTQDEAEQLQVQLAGCAVAALDGSTRIEAERGSYGWSQSYDDVLKLSRCMNKVRSLLGVRLEDYEASNYDAHKATIDKLWKALGSKVAQPLQVAKIGQVVRPTEEAWQNYEALNEGRPESWDRWFRITDHNPHQNAYMFESLFWWWKADQLEARGPCSKCLAEGPPPPLTDMQLDFIIEGGKPWEAQIHQKHARGDCYDGVDEEVRALYTAQSKA